MSYSDFVKVWSDAMDKIYQTGWFKRLNEGKLSKDHYLSYLVETFHHAGQNPQLQAFATMYFKDNLRDVIKRFYQHAISEIGHDLLALDDAVALGLDREKVMTSRPLATTVAFNAFPFFQIQKGNTIGYLGYLFHLEHLPTRDGNKIIETLKSKGIPDAALTFLQEHSTVDHAHTKLMQNYIDQLVVTEKDFAEMCSSLRDSALLHKYMLESAFERAEDPSWTKEFISTKVSRAS